MSGLEEPLPVSTMVGASPAVSVFDSMKVILPGMSISKRCICYEKNKCYRECYMIRQKVPILAEGYLNSTDVLMVFSTTILLNWT